jgi:hypothetical protein
MSRTFKVDSPGKVRSQVMRTAAEILRHLSQKQALDAETKDLTALMVFCLRQIAQGIDESAMAWEKRDYWVKAERFRQRWSWAGRHAARLEKLVRREAWDQLPEMLAELFPNFAGVKVTRFTRESALWDGAYERLLTDSESVDAL